MMKTLHAVLALAWSCVAWAADDPTTPGGFRLRSEATAGQDGGQVFPKPYSPPCVERENVFEFTEKLAVKNLGNDKYEITFAVKGNCDVTAGIVDEKGFVVRHLGAGVLGPNAPLPFQKNSLKQTIYWNGKDDLDEYHKTPEKLKVRVMLGLKPEFDKLLGGASPKRLPGNVQGIAISPDGVCVLAKGPGPAGFGTPPHGHTTARWFDHDGNYVRTISPPPANMPEEKLGGMGFLEYEPGKRALHGPYVHETISINGFFLPGINGLGVVVQQAALIGTRIYYCNNGQSKYIVNKNNFKLHYFNSDGSTDLKGMSGIPLWPAGAYMSCLAASPDGKWIYVTTDDGAGGVPPVVMRASSTGDEPHKVFAGDPKQPGSDNQHLNQPRGLDCDAQGRVYVCDGFNSRIQVFAPDGKWLKNIPVERPVFLRIHQKTGGLYLLQEARVEGKTLSRLTKLASFDSPKEEWHMDNFIGAILALDSWTPKPRLWVAGDKAGVNVFGAGGATVQIYEEDGKTLRKIADFDEEAKKEDGEGWFGRWGGSLGGGWLKLVCDPLRNKVWFHDRIFDLETGKYLGVVRFSGNPVNDLAFDKRGYVHAHFDPQGVGRFDPDRKSPDGRLKEVPYDYGIEAKNGLLGILPVRDQPGAKTFQDGLGVNMRGEVAEDCIIYYVPKMEDEGKAFAMEGSNSRIDYNEEDGNWASFERSIQDMQKRGEEVYFIRRQPGIPLTGATIWTFDRSGEVRTECAAIIGRHIAGLEMDEDGRLYWVTARPKMVGGKPFLAGKGGTFGAPEDKANRDPFTATLVKSRSDKVRIVSKNGPVPLEEAPARPVEFSQEWCEGAEWIYAGASPVVEGGCTCPTLRFHTDWYKRTFVPEAYRHSIGILDTNGNLIMHVGRYGNFDSGLGARSKIPIGGDNIAMIMPRFIAGTDDHLVFYDWGERVAVLRLNYHAEETAPITLR